MKMWASATIACSLIAVSAGLPAQSPAAPQTPEARAVGYLTAEVPRWRREHPCYSCHNNGDAARALIAAARRGHPLNGALDDTLTWLQHPERWDAVAVGGGVDDKPLAHIQFAGALASAVDAGLAPRSALDAAARIVAADQQADGSWTLDSSQSVGSPATYGTALATWSARRTLRQAGGPALAPAIERADRWLRAVATPNVLDSAALVLALADAADAAGQRARARALDLLMRAQAPDGGWGLYETSPSEPFDTAVAMLALVEFGRSPAPLAAIARGRQYLIERQSADGSWPETTRPAGQESYAQRISTAGWATLALLATGESGAPELPAFALSRFDGSADQPPPRLRRSAGASAKAEARVNQASGGGKLGPTVSPGITASPGTVR
jgi:hypothetical protein